MSLDNIGTCGLGLRRQFMGPLLAMKPHPVDFLEIVPENWLGIGGKRQKILRAYSEQYPMICHGLSLSIGGLVPLDMSFIESLKRFFHNHKIQLYSEHLSFCSDSQGQLYDLMPIPFTEEAVRYVVKRINQVQETLQQRIALENISYYALPKGDMSEADFINAVLREADCLLLLDVNNVYVNSVNHGYNAYRFIDQMPTNKIAYIHIAGHWQKAPDLIIDTHGDKVIEPVWQLLNYTYQKHGLLPTLLERDNEVPQLEVLLQETKQLQQLQQCFIEGKAYAI